MAEDLIDLRLRSMRAASQHTPRLPGNLRQQHARGVVVPTPAADSQPAVVAGVITKGSTTRDFLRYLQREKGHDRTAAHLFTRPGQDVDAARFAAEAQHDPRQFRLAISLGSAARFVALQPFTEWLMARLEKDLGHAVEWVGAVHHDTPHPHAHVAIRGTLPSRTDDREALVIARHYLTNGLRSRASQLATWLLGRAQGAGSREQELTQLQQTLRTELATWQRAPEPQRDRQAMREQTYGR
jgi:type IV secretory pathway VirD2 relaxase